jgi:hypothetical protein
MTWYAAHIVIGFTAEGRKEVVAWENIILIDADSHEQAEQQAIKIGQEEASLDDALTVNDRPAKRLFAGVRKVLTIANPDPAQQLLPPVHGSEISFSEFILKDIDELMKLGSGKGVHLRYTEK